MTRHVLFCATPAYLQHVAVAAVSLASNGGAGRWDIHLVTCEPDAAAEAALRDSLAPFAALTLHLHRVPRARIESLFVDKYLAPECYLRLVAPDLLPPTIERILYLDCDIVVLDDLRPLLAGDLAGRVVGAAPDYPIVPHVVERHRLEALGIPADGVYVNSGVLLIDLAAWRREGLTARLLRYIADRGAALEFHDQDAINAVLHDRIQVLDPRWNLQARMFRSGRRAHPLEFEATRLARRRPAILHYVGAEKPWKFRTRTARKGDYVRYLARTEWRGARPPLATPLERAEWRMDRALARAGIDYLQVLWRLGRLPALARRAAGAAVTAGLTSRPEAGAK